MRCLHNPAAQTVYYSFRSKPPPTLANDLPESVPLASLLVVTAARLSATRIRTCAISWKHFRFYCSARELR